LRILCDPKDPKKYGEAREALISCLEFTPADEPVWRAEREFLLVVLAELDLRNSGEKKALEWLMPPEELSTRLALTIRSHLLDKLSRREEAEASLAAADKQAVQEEYENLLAGVARLSEGDWEKSCWELNKVLRDHPDSYTARLLMMVACLRAKASKEAEVGLTACIGDRPDSPLGYLLRAEARLDQGDAVWCAGDLLAAWERARNGAAQGLVETTRDRLLGEVARMPPERAEEFWRAEVKTRDGARAIRHIELFNKMKAAGG